MESGEKMCASILSSYKVEFAAIELMLVSVDQRNMHSGVLLLRWTSKEDPSCMGTTLEGIQVIQSCWKYMICVENGDSTHAFFIPGGIFFM